MTSLPASSGISPGKSSVNTAQDVRAPMGETSKSHFPGGRPSIRSKASFGRGGTASDELRCELGIAHKLCFATPALPHAVVRTVTLLVSTTIRVIGDHRFRTSLLQPKGPKWSCSGRRAHVCQSRHRRPAMAIMLTVAFALTTMIAVTLTLCPRSRRKRELDYSYRRDQNIASSIVLPGLTHYEAPERSSSS